jgi:hypothetical protein
MSIGRIGAVHHKAVRESLWRPFISVGAPPLKRKPPRMTASGGDQMRIHSHACAWPSLTDGIESGLFDGDGVLFADFHAAFTAEALLGINRDGLAVFHLENFHWTYVDTFFATNALFMVNCGDKCHLNCLL